MVERTIDERIRVVLLYIDGHTVAEEICAMHGIPLRTFRRWVSAYRNGGIEALKSKKRGPKSGTNSIRAKLELRIIELKQKTSFLWCAADQVSVRPALLLGYCSQSDKTPSDAHHDQTKPQPSKRFQRKHVDSLWQGDSLVPVPHFERGVRCMLLDSLMTDRVSE